MIVILAKSAIYFNAEPQSRRAAESQSTQREFKVRSQGLDSGVGGGAKVRANGYGVFAEVP